MFLLRCKDTKKMGIGKRISGIYRFSLQKRRKAEIRNQTAKATGLPAWFRALPAHLRGKEASAAETPLKKDSCGRYRAHLPTQ